MIFKPCHSRFRVIRRPFILALLVPFTRYGFEVVFMFKNDLSLGFFFGFAGIIPRRQYLAGSACFTPPVPVGILGKGRAERKA